MIGAVFRSFRGIIFYSMTLPSRLMSKPYLIKLPTARQRPL